MATSIGATALETPGFNNIDKTKKLVLRHAPLLKLSRLLQPLNGILQHFNRNLKIC
jgi:hypothetical protein